MRGIMISETLSNGTFVQTVFQISKALIHFSLLFRFIFIPYIQREVNAWVHQCNWTKRRADRKKVLPNGIPMIILQKPHKWKAADYKVCCTCNPLLHH